MTQRVWFDRRFTLGLPREALPDLLERLRGTPARLRERTSGLPPEALRDRINEGWSIQEQAGHLVDLEALWFGRLDDFADERSTLRSADLENRATWDAHHNTRELSDILMRFHDSRARFLARVERMSEEELGQTAEHPRLRQPMTVADLCFFVAEHDDHHLATITSLRGAIRGRERTSVRQLWPLLSVKDIQRSMDFYTAKLGFEVVGRAEGEGGLFWCRVQRGGACLMLQQDEVTESAADQATRAIQFYFICDDADTMFAEMSEGGLSVDPPKLASYGMKQLFVTDPDGYPLCFESPTQGWSG